MLNRRHRLGKDYRMAQRLAAWGSKAVSGTLGKTVLHFRGWSKALFYIMPTVLFPLHTGLSRAAQPHLQTFWSHARVELGPPGPSQWPAIKKGFGK